MWERLSRRDLAQRALGRLARAVGSRSAGKAKMLGRWEVEPGPETVTPPSHSLSSIPAEPTEMSR